MLAQNKNKNGPTRQWIARLLVVALMSAAASVVVASPNASACWCGDEPGTVLTSLVEGSAAITGHVVDRELFEDGGTSYVTARFLVGELLAEEAATTIEAGSTITVKAFTDDSMCGWRPVIDGQYALVVRTLEDDQWSTSSCGSGMLMWELGWEYPEPVDNPEPIDNPEPVDATVFTHVGFSLDRLWAFVRTLLGGSGFR